MTQPSTPSSVPLTYYMETVRSRWWVVLLCALFGLGVAAGYIYISPKAYTATATVNVNVISSDPFNASRSASGLIDPGGEAQVAGSYAVAERAASELGPNFTPTQVRESVTVISVADTTILRISSTADNAKDARAIADTVADQYVAFRSTQAETRIQGAIDRSEARLSGLREDLADVTSRLANAEEGTPEAMQAETDRSVLTLEISSVLSEMANTGTIDTNGGTILNPASGNSVQVAPRPSLTLAAGGLAGLGLGLGVAFLVSAAASRVRDHRDIALNDGRIVLGELSSRNPTIPLAGSDLTQMRAARERMLADATLTSRTGVCAVVDLTDGRAEDVAVNLAYVVAAAGVQVDFVGLGMSEELVSQIRSSLHLFSTDGDDGHYGSSANPNLTCYLPVAGNQDSDEELIPGGIRGEIATRSQDVLVMVAVPATTTEATRLAAAQLSDTAVLVVARGTTRTARLQEAARDVRHMGSEVLGTLVVTQDRGSSSNDARPEVPASSRRTSSHKRRARAA